MSYETVLVYNLKTELHSRANIPSNAMVGRYSVISEIKSNSGTEEYAGCTIRYVMPDVLVVFNPFSKSPIAFN